MALFRKLRPQGLLYTSTLKWQTKVLLALIAMLIIISIIIYSQFIVNDIIQKEKRIIQTYSKIYKNLLAPDANVEDYLFMLDDITPHITFPMIMTDANDLPNYPFEQYSLNVKINPNLSIKEQRVKLIKMISDMKSNYEPLIINDTDGKVLFKLYYTHSNFVDILRYYPFVTIIIIATFILFGYLAYSTSRKSEETKVWVGMSKEAAHQLGTPLSSLMAWVEILRFTKDDPEEFENTILEVQNDLDRLSTIANRFSKIGSLPELKDDRIDTMIYKTIEYFNKRLPHLGRRVEIVSDIEENLDYKLNYDLFVWVLENLIKNAAESMDRKSGTITIEAKKSDYFIVINISDTGRGMTSKVKNQIFNPGFTTKKRGWGLGLSLCKRIIEEYHNGKIYVRETMLNHGTTFTIELPIYVD
jgi:anti-sigma regulatory factor (Ser/Thr protein kinase)